MKQSLQSRVIKLDNAKYHGRGRQRSDIDLIVMHCTGGASAHSSITWMNRHPIPAGSKTSYHYIIDRDGTIYRMCQPELVAYHAGASKVPRVQTSSSSVNPHSLGIAWANLNNGEPLTQAQVESALWLCSVFIDQCNIPIDRVVGHNEVSPGRKSDPAPAVGMDEFRGILRNYLKLESAACKIN